MALAGMKVSLGDEDRELLATLAKAIGDLATELHTYNHPPVYQMAVEDTHPTEVQEGRRTIKIPPGAGEYSFDADGMVKHKWPLELDTHGHSSVASFLNCLTRAGVL